MSTTRDAIDLTTTVAAPPDQVWALVGEPGWFINTGQLTRHSVTRQRDEVVVVDPECGRFRFRIDEEGERTHRLTSLDEVGHGRSVTTTVTPDGDGSRVRVVETGFAAMPGSDEDRFHAYDDNARAWTLELQLAKDRLEGA